MDKLELLRSALRAIRTNKTRSVLTTLGIIIGVASVILLTSIGAGLQKFVTAEFEALGSNVLFVAPGKVNFGGGPPQNAEAKFDFEDVRNIERLGEPIVQARGMVSRGLTVKRGSESFYGTLVGVSEDYLEVSNVEIEQGEFFSKSSVERSQMVAVIGHKVYVELFKGVGNVIGKEIDVAGRSIKIGGLLKEKGGGFGGGGDENTYVLMPVTAAQKVTGIKKPAAVMVKTVDAEGTILAAKKIKRYFYNKKLTDDDFTVMEPKELLSSINSFLGVVTGALSGIAGISLVVGGIGIANIMLVSVTERTREIGLRKAVGATPGDIMLQFLLEAVVLSALGGMIGIMIGAGLGALLSRFIETNVTGQSVMLAFGISSAVGIISGLAPAVRAARLDPIVALRYE
jgi:putative ABC transport system permease protein